MKTGSKIIGYETETTGVNEVSKKLVPTLTNDPSRLNLKQKWNFANDTVARFLNK